MTDNLQKSVTSIDRMEMLTFEKIDLAGRFNILEQKVPDACVPIVKQLQSKYATIFDSWKNLCEELHSKILETQETNKIIKQEQERLKRIEQEKERQRNRLYAMKEVKLQVQEKEFQDSLARIREMWEENIEELEHTLNEHKQNRLKRGAEQLSHMEEVEREMSQFLELTPRLNLTLDVKRLRDDYSDYMPSHRRTQSNPRSASKKKEPDYENEEIDINESAEFDKLMDELQQDKDVDQSRMSMDKTIGGWASEYDSEPEASSIMNQTTDLNSLLIALQEKKLLKEDEIRAIENMRDNATETYRMEALKDMLKVLAKKVNISKREVTAEDSKNFNAPFASPRRFEFKSGRKNSFRIAHEMQSPNISMDLAVTSPRNILPSTGILLKTQTSFQGSSFLDSKIDDSKEAMNLESLLNASCEQLSWIQPASFIDGPDESVDPEPSKYILEQDWSSLPPVRSQSKSRGKLSGEIDTTSHCLDSTKWTASLKSRIHNQSELRESVDCASVSFVNNI